MSDRTVAHVEAWKCAFMLPQPFKLGHKTIDRREYVFVRVTDDQGAQGSAFALTRGAPTDLVITELIGGGYLGRRYDEPEALRKDVAQAILPHYQEGVVGRAMSLIDNALWDLLGQAAGQPVSRLLGGRREAAPVLLVEGYPIDGQDDDQFIERMLSRVDEGYRHLKVAYGATDPEGFTRRLRKLMQRMPDDVQVNVDIAWVWKDPALARPILDAWRNLPLSWIEDPCANDDIDTLLALKTLTDIPLAIGDEVTRPEVLLNAVRSGATDIVRFDASCAGGLSGLKALTEAPEMEGVPISTHVYPEVHTHGVLGLTEIGPVEMFPANRPWDVTTQFVAPPTVELVDGVQSVVASTSPGLGVALNWDHINSNALRRSAVPTRD